MLLQFDLYKLLATLNSVLTIVFIIHLIFRAKDYKLKTYFDRLLLSTPILVNYIVLFIIDKNNMKDAISARNNIIFWLLLTVVQIFFFYRRIAKIDEKIENIDTEKIKIL